MAKPNPYLMNFPPLPEPKKPDNGQDSPPLTEVEKKLFEKIHCELDLAEKEIPARYRLTEDEKKWVENRLLVLGLPLNVNVTFGDVALAEWYSETRSRSEINDFSLDFIEGISLDVPVILANMECVAGVRSIVAMEREGGLGIIPQMLPIEKRLEMLEMIGRAECALIDRPLTITKDKTLRQAKAVMNRYRVYSLVVIDSQRRPIGILSTRDWLYETDETKLVSELMGGKRKLYTAPRNVSFAEAAKILRKHRIEKLPLIGKYGRLAGLITAKGLFYNKHYPRATRDDKGRFLKVGSIGVGQHFTKKHLEEVELQVKAGISMLLIDTARAFSVNTSEAIQTVRARFPNLPLMVGNVSTPEGAKCLFEQGVDVVKVGQGPGEACRTREIGIGIPQLSAVAKCAAIAHYFSEGDGKMRAIVADGGIKNPGDIAKAIIAGASAVMSGAMFIGTEESEAPADLTPEGLRVKEYIGSASSRAQRNRMGRDGFDRMRRPEGVAKLVPVTGTIADRMHDIIDGLRSCMSYLGVNCATQLQLKGRFELQTNAGLFEGTKKK
ncbi:MAG: IMP dehydrogenase [Parcubacteria group bacterium Gr01-1014_3]|nr:MAG: IMP dehydrogenase [Parcubacteria group bacterium Gr01-1014_3]